MVAARAVTILTGSFFPLIARVEQENFSHHGLGKFFKGGRVAGLADFVAYIGCWSLLGCFGFRRPDDSKKTNNDKTQNEHRAAQRFMFPPRPLL